MEPNTLFIIVFIVGGSSPLWFPTVAWLVEGFIRNIATEYFGYLPDKIANHKRECTCEICLDNLDRDIKRLERELEIGQ